MSAETALNSSNSPTLTPPGMEPPATDVQTKLGRESDARLQAALAASARAEASLSGLFRAIQHLDNGVGGAREANDSLTVELEGLRQSFGSASDQQASFAGKLAEVELALDRARKEHQRERAFLIAQHDAFLLKLLDEQELELRRRDTELDALRGRLSELEQREPVTLPPPFSALPSAQAPFQLFEPKPGDEASRSAALEHAELERTLQKLADDRERARETIARLHAQRDEAQSATVRISKERDDALYEIQRLKSELGGPRIPLSSRPPAEARRDSAALRAFTSAATLNLDQIEMEARLGSPTLPSPSGAPTSSAPGPNPTPISSVLRPPPASPDAAALATRLSPPPSRLSPTPTAPSPAREELRRRLMSQPAIQSSASGRPPLQQKPDVSGRPLVGYSLGTDSVQPEHIERYRPSRPGPDTGKR